MIPSTGRWLPVSGCAGPECLEAAAGTPSLGAEGHPVAAAELRVGTGAVHIVLAHVGCAVAVRGAATESLADLPVRRVRQVVRRGRAASVLAFVDRAAAENGERFFRARAVVAPGLGEFSA